MTTSPAGPGGAGDALQDRHVLGELARALHAQGLSARLDQGPPFPVLWVRVPHSHARHELVLVNAAGDFAYDGGHRSVDASDIAGAATVIARHVHAQSPGRNQLGAWTRQ